MVGFVVVLVFVDLVVCAFFAVFYGVFVFSFGGVCILGFGMWGVGVFWVCHALYFGISPLYEQIYVRILLKI